MGVSKKKRTKVIMALKKETKFKVKRQDSSSLLRTFKLMINLGVFLQEASPGFKELGKLLKITFRGNSSKALILMWLLNLIILATSSSKKKRT